MTGHIRQTWIQVKTRFHGCFRQALALHRQTKSRRGEGQALTALGLAYYDLGQYKQALKYHQQALIIHRETKNRLDEAGI